MLRFGAAPADYPHHGRAPSLLGAAVVRQVGRDIDAVWRLGAHQLQARLEEVMDDNAAAVILPFDEALELRALAAIRLVRLLQHRPPGPDPAPLSVTRRTRLVQAIRALDARSQGASMREVAEAVFGRRVAGRAWQDSDVQARTRRLVRSGALLMQGGYRDLLNPLRRRRHRPGDEGDSS